MSSTPTTRVKRIPLRRALMLTALTSLAGALMIVGALWVQMLDGRDPALGPKITATRPARSSPDTAPTPLVPNAGSDEGEATADGFAIVPSAPPTPQPVAPSPAPVQTQTS